MADERVPTRPWDPAEHLETDDDIAAYLDAALAEGDLDVVPAALDDIARAQGVTQAARFVQLLEEARQRVKITGGVSLAEMRRRLQRATNRALRRTLNRLLRSTCPV